MKHLQTLSTTLALLAFVSVANATDTTKTLAKVHATATKVVDTTKAKVAKAVDTTKAVMHKATEPKTEPAKIVEPAKPAEVATPVESAKTPDTTKAKKVKAPKAKKTEAKADTAKTAAGPSVTGGKTCDDVKSMIEEKMKARGVAKPILTVTPAADVKDGKVVGSCGGGSKKIVYTKG
jgi:hypothetical protein